MQHQRNDLTPRPNPVSARGTGPSRNRRPVYVDLLPPCSNACPAGEQIQAWLAVGAGPSGLAAAYRQRAKAGEARRS
jgi:hypothetical protein